MPGIAPCDDKSRGRFAYARRPTEDDGLLREVFWFASTALCGDKLFMLQVNLVPACSLRSDLMVCVLKRHESSAIIVHR